MLGADFVVQVLIIRGAFGSGRIGYTAIQVQNALQLAQRRADVAALIGDHCRLVELLFFLARPRVFLFQAAHFREHLQRASILRPELKNALQRLARVVEVKPSEVLTGEAEPLFHVAFGTFVFDAALEAEGLYIGRIQLQDLIDSLQR